MNLSELLQKYYPSSAYTHSGNYETLVWNDTSIKKPTKKQIDKLFVDELTIDTLSRIDKRRDISLNSLKIDGIKITYLELSKMSMYENCIAGDTLYWINEKNEIKKYTRKKFKDILNKAVLQLQDLYLMNRKTKDNFLNGIN